MTVFVNLDQLPPGQSLYTLYLTWEDEPSIDAECEELDVMARRNLSAQQVVDAAWAEISADYEPGAAVLGIVDQSAAGYVLFDGNDSGRLLRSSTSTAEPESDPERDAYNREAEEQILGRPLFPNER